jgi:hypothetical protein
MDDIRLRDLSQIPESDLTAEERRELRRRFEEFVGRLRKKGGLSAAQEPDEEAEKQVRRWDPRSMTQRH